MRTLPTLGGLAMLLAAVAVLSAPADAQRRDREQDRSPPPASDRYRGGGDWQPIGTVQYTPRLERASLRLQPGSGLIGRIALEISEGAAEVVEVVVTYGNNTTEVFPVRERMDDKSRAKFFDLAGRGRYVRDVTVVYQPLRQTRIELFADAFRPSRPGPRWEQLGCKRIGFMDRIDVIRVGANQGRFSALKLTADGHNVRLDRLRVFYQNGTSETINVRALLPDGSETRSFDLDGRRRVIDRIELNYLPSLNPGARSTVCAFGS